MALKAKIKGGFYMNTTSLIGRIANNFEVKQVNNISITNFKLAVDTSRKNKEGNGYETAFLNIIAFGKTAQNTHKYMGKGDTISVTGELRSRMYEKNGMKITVIEIAAKNIEFIKKLKQINNNHKTKMVIIISSQ